MTKQPIFQTIKPFLIVFLFKMIYSGRKDTKRIKREILIERVRKSLLKRPEARQFRLLKCL